MVYKIGERDIGLMYTIGVHCDYSDILIEQPDISVAAALIEKALLMNQAYLEATKSQAAPLTREDLRAMPFWQFAELTKAIKEQENIDSRIEIHTKEPEDQQKNAGSAVKSQ